MVSYNDLRPASFRGFKFLTPADNITQERRITRHEYPQKDEPYHEEMGLGARTFRIDAVVQGADYIARAMSFEQKLNQAGAGILIHPFFGAIEIIITSYTVNNKYDELGHIIFSITAEKHGKPMYPRAVDHSASALIATSDEGFNTLLSDFNSRFALEGFPEFVKVDALARMDLFFDDLDRSLNRVSGTFSTRLNDLGQIGTSVTDIFKTLALTGAPIKAAAIAGIAQRITPPDLWSLFDGLRRSSAFSVADKKSSALTITQSRRVSNAQSLDFLLRGEALMAAARTATYLNYESREQAVRTRKNLSNALTEIGQEMADAGWDESWKATEAVNAAVVRDINERIGRLPYTMRIRPASARSSLVVSHYLYGDNPQDVVARADDIVKRNKVRNPALLPPQSLEVLVDE